LWALAGEETLQVLMNVLACLLRYVAIIIPVVITLFLVRYLLPVPHEVFRKVLHAVAFTSTPLIMWLAGDWHVACLTLLVVGAVVWPILAALERVPLYSYSLVERHMHEIRRSMLLFFWGDALLVALCWGLFGNPQATATSVLMWGFVDASAALVGKRWGRHHTELPLADPAKTWEGSGAMCVVSTVVGVASLMAFGAAGVLGCLVCAVVAAVVGAYVELITKNGNDTITVPFAIAAVLLAFALLA
jgi:dolichol kinase